MERNIEILCRKKQQELIDKYFPFDTASELIGEYSKDLPLKIEAEYRDFLENLWSEYSDAPLVLEERKLRQIMTESDKDAVDQAYGDACEITLWEKITKSNHNDVNRYKGLLHDYTQNLLTVMRIDFLEEITGLHINSKTFE